MKHVKMVTYNHNQYQLPHQEIRIIFMSKMCIIVYRYLKHQAVVYTYEDRSCMHAQIGSPLDAIASV